MPSSRSHGLALPVALALLAGTLAAGQAVLAQTGCIVTQVTVTADGANLFPTPSVSGSRVAFTSSSTSIGSNADGNDEVFVRDTGSGTLLQVTNTTTGNSDEPFLDAAGNRLAFYSDSTQLGSNADGNVEIYVYDIAAAQLIQVTTTVGGSSFNPRISGNGSRVAFHSDIDPLGTNADGNVEIFVYDIATGTFIQATNTTTGNAVSAVLDFDGSVVAFTSSSTQLGTNPEGNDEVYLYDLGTTALTQATQTTGGSSYANSLSSDGRRVAFWSTSTQLGTNPEGNNEAYVFDVGSGLQQVTQTPSGASTGPSLSGNGQRVAFRSSSTALGSNPEGNGEIYLFDVAQASLTQVTQTTSGNADDARIAGSGGAVVFESDSPQLGTNPEGNDEVYVGVCGVPAVPTASGWGLGLLTLLLAAAATSLLLRRRAG